MRHDGDSHRPMFSVRSEPPCTRAICAVSASPIPEQSCKLTVSRRAYQYSHTQHLQLYLYLQCPKYGCDIVRREVGASNEGEVPQCRQRHQWHLCQTNLILDQSSNIPVRLPVSRSLTARSLRDGADGKDLKPRGFTVKSRHASVLTLFHPVHREQIATAHFQHLQIRGYRSQLEKQRIHLE